MTFAGELSLWVALLMSGWCALASFAGDHWRRADLTESGTRALYASAVLIALGTIGLLVALLRQDFSLTLVAATTGLNLPWPYRIAALWSTPSGATLCLALATSLATAVALWSRRRRGGDEIAARFAGSAGLFLLFLLLLIRAGADPYDALPVPPVDGAGMHPSLQRPGMLLHPTLLAAAIGAASVPCLLALCSVAAGRLPPGVWSRMRRFGVVSWGLLTLALVAGMWWTHVTRTAARSWPLDPIVHGTVLPWLMLGAFGWLSSRGTRPGATIGIVFSVGTLLVALPLMLATQLGLMLPPARQIVSPAGLAIMVLILVGTGAIAALARERVRWTEPPQPLEPARRPAIATGIALTGFVLLVGGIIGHIFRDGSTAAVHAGESIVRADPFGREWRFVNEGVSVFPQANRRVLVAGLGLFRGTSRVGTLAPEMREYVTANGEPTHAPASVPAVRARFDMDVIASVQERGADHVLVRIDFEPLASLAWIGGLFFAVGGALFMWPREARA